MSGWQFTLAEFVGGLVLIVVMALLLRLFVSRRLEQARAHAVRADAGHEHHTAEAPLTLRQRVVSLDAWSQVASKFRNDWAMVWKEITIGFFLAGFIGLLGNDFLNKLFITNSNHALRTIENVLVGLIVAILSFVYSVGNVPLAAVLWSGGISFSGVLAFIFADLIVIPIILIYRKYYGGTFAVRITALMFVTIVISALIIGAVFGVLGLIPAVRPTRSDIFESVRLNYKLVLNVLGLIVFAALFGLTMRRGANHVACAGNHAPSELQHEHQHAQEHGDEHAQEREQSHQHLQAGEQVHGR